MPAPTSPPQATRAVATTFLRQRPWVVLPMVGLLVVLLGLGRGLHAQTAVVAVMGSCALSFFFWEAKRGRREVVTDLRLFVSLAITIAGIGGITILTGGSRSPLLLMVFAPTVIGFAAFGRSRRSDALFAFGAAVITLIAVVPNGLPFEPLAEPSRRLMLVAAGSCALVLLRLGVTALSDAHRTARDAAAGAGEELVASAQARGEALEAMGAKVAHEVKNPLSAIRGLVEVMAEKSADDRDKKRLEVIRGEVDRIDEILRGYLALAKPLDQLSPRSTDVARLAREVAAVTEGRAERAGIALAVDADSLEWEVDARRIKEALLNLVLNAFDATQPGGVVTIRAKAPDGALSLEVEDTGAGMAPEDLANAAQPYWSKKAGGTGLGLALARAVAEGHGGALEVESRPGEGTRMRLRIPARSST